MKNVFLILTALLGISKSATAGVVTYIPEMFFTSDAKIAQAGLELVLDAVPGDKVGEDNSKGIQGAPRLILQVIYWPIGTAIGLTVFALDGQEIKIQYTHTELKDMGYEEEEILKIGKEKEASIQFLKDMGIVR